MKRVCLSNGKVIEVDDVKADRLVRKRRATYIEAAVKVPQRQAIMPRAQAR